MRDCDCGHWSGCRGSTTDKPNTNPAYHKGYAAGYAQFIIRTDYPTPHAPAVKGLREAAKALAHYDAWNADENPHSSLGSMVVQDLAKAARQYLSLTTSPEVLLVLKDERNKWPVWLTNALLLGNVTPEQLIKMSNVAYTEGQE